MAHDLRGELFHHVLAGLFEFGRDIWAEVVLLDVCFEIHRRIIACEGAEAGKGDRSGHADEVVEYVGIDRDGTFE